ncbi:MAG: acyltransferase family protein [Methanobacteriaceae archaeon]|jgi:surface polysaccharide O-acyltransferase-like enzyme|nr:acyltransferase family protein [Candidatus Methanorudis spinitermitis]
MRKHFLDNLRWIFILLLFPFHTFRIYDVFENFYIKGSGNIILTNFIIFFGPWIMALFFVIAGISAFYSLKKRNSKEFLKERLLRLFIPFISGLIILIPIQTFFAEKFHFSVTENYFSQLITFFTKFGDLTGYTGGFTPGHLWFILYLFIISLIALPLIKLYENSSINLNFDKISIIKIISLFIVFWIMSGILDIGGKSLGLFFSLFIVAYFIFSSDKILENIEKYRWHLSTIFLACSIINLMMYSYWGSGILHMIYSDWTLKILFSFFIVFLSWTAILSFVGMGKKYLSFHNKWTEYFTKASYPIYLFHQTWIVAVAYYTFLFTSSLILQIIIILFGSFILTIISYELVKRTKLTRFLFGIKA